MADKASLQFANRPRDYKVPGYTEVRALADSMRRNRQAVIDRMWARKRARRGQWEDIVARIPASYRKLLLPPDLPQINDMINRVAGLIAKEPPQCQVMPPSGKEHDVKAASKEERCLNAVRLQIADQQDRDPYAMGIDAQIALGESWIGVFPDSMRLADNDYNRRSGESANEYLERYKETMADCGIPIRIIDFDPMTVLAFRGDNERNVMIIVETEHLAVDIEQGLGYKPIRNDDGKIIEWINPGTLSEPYVPSEIRDGEGGYSPVDTTHDVSRSTGTTPIVDRPVRKTIYVDCWVYQIFLDDVLVELWEHNYGIVPMFPAGGEQSSDRDPAWQNQSIIDPALAIAKQVILYSAILAANAMQHGFPTPFVKNPVHGLVGLDGLPLTRKIQLGEMNFLGPSEEIEFPYLEAQMMPDFFKYMEYLSSTLEATTFSNLGEALGTDIAGYAIAQIRASQMSNLGPVYRNAEKQWRKIYYFLRFLVKHEYPSGIYLRGAVEETDNGAQYRPIMEYSERTTTPYSIECHIAEGIPQDEIAERKSAIEMKESGLWSPRRAMEHTGVEDPHAEMQEIKTYRQTNSPAYDQMVLTLAMSIAQQRANAIQDQQFNTPFMQALEAGKKSYMGGGGQFQNQGAAPVNADAAGQPLQQQAQLDAPQEGGPMTGTGDMSQFGVPETPGGVQQQRPALV